MDALEDRIAQALAPVIAQEAERRATDRVGAMFAEACEKLSCLTTPPVPPLLEADEVGAILKCSAKSVSDLRRSGKLAGVYVGNTYKYTPTDVQAYIAYHREDRCP